MTNTKIEKAVEEFCEVNADKSGPIHPNANPKWVRKALLTAYQQGKKDRDKEILNQIESMSTYTVASGVGEGFLCILKEELKTFINQNNEK